jgi:hypothetical protein
MGPQPGSGRPVQDLAVGQRLAEAQGRVAVGAQSCELRKGRSSSSLRQRRPSACLADSRQRTRAVQRVMTICLPLPGTSGAGPLSVSGSPWSMAAFHPRGRRSGGNGFSPSSRQDSGSPHVQEGLRPGVLTRGAGQGLCESLSCLRGWGAHLSFPRALSVGRSPH